MRISRVFCIAAAVTVFGIAAMCNKDSSPTSPASPPENVLFSDGFEGNNLDSLDSAGNGYTKIYNPRAYGSMSITTKPPIPASIR